MINLKSFASAPLPRKIAMMILAITALSIFPFGGGLFGLLQSLGINIGFATSITGPLTVGSVLSLANLWIFFRLAQGKML